MRVLLDADATIKLYRCGILAMVLDALPCVVPEPVFHEVVTQGKLRMHGDAEGIEAAWRGKIQVVPNVGETRKDVGLGAGESSLLNLAEVEPGALVVSDDRRFLNLLRTNGISSLPPTAVVVLLATMGAITSREGRTGETSTPDTPCALRASRPGLGGLAMKSKVVPLRIPEHLDELAALSAREQHTDKATALRQWLYKGAAEYILKLVEEGRISIGRGAELLNVTIYDIQHLAQAHGVILGATEEQYRQSLDLVRRLAEERLQQP